MQTKLFPPMSRAAACALLLATASACGDVLSSPAPDAPARSARGGAAQPDVQVAARALARALAAPEARQQLLADLRDSPFPGHRIHIQSYLRSAGAAGLTASAARAAGVEPQAFTGMLGRLPALEIVVLRPEDRVHWKGSDSLAVFGMVDGMAAWARQGALRGYTPAGDSVSLGALERPDYVPVVIRPAEVDFGTDPEARRRGAASLNRPTISRREDEFTLTPQTTINPWPPFEIAPFDGGYEMYLGNAYCFTADGDGDSDGVRDECEYRLAEAFRPYMRMQGNDVCPSREPYWAAARDPEVTYGIKIFYLPAYHHDCARGSVGGLGGAHYGDSEFVIVSAKNFGGSDTRWFLQTVTMSAHNGTPASGTRTFGYDDSRISYPDQARGAPLVWVALDKHGNFPTRAECEAGGYNYDTCTTNFYDTRLEVLSDANIGNSAHQLRNWVYSRVGYPNPEVLWSTAIKFCGWQNISDPTGPGYPWVSYHTCAGTYGSLLRDYGF